MAQAQPGAKHACVHGMAHVRACVRALAAGIERVQRKMSAASAMASCCGRAMAELREELEATRAEAQRHVKRLEQQLREALNGPI